jgi:hypothetical protein
MIMQTKPSRFWCLLLLGILVIVGFTQGAAINTINAGNTVFLGEQGLDISAAMGTDTRIGWWASGADVVGSSPTKTIDVSSQLTSFSVTPSEFSSYLGTWTRIDNTGKANGAAFIVADPNLNLRVEDTTVSVDVTDKWVPTGDSIRFRLESNLAQIASQRNSPALITIKVQPPGGGVFNALIDPAGSTVSIVDIPLTTTPMYYKDAPIWDTGNRGTYPPGSYTIWAECNTNKMKDNYEQSGKTVSAKISLLNQDNNPLISAKTQTPAATPTITTSVTTEPATLATTALPTTQTPTKTITPVPTTILATVTATAEPYAPVSSIPVSPSSTKSPGFESALAGISIFIAIALFCKRWE